MFHQVMFCQSSLSSFPIVHLLSLTKIALRHNFLSALLTIAGGVIVSALLHNYKGTVGCYLEYLLRNIDLNISPTDVFWLSHSCVHRASRDNIYKSCPLSMWYDTIIIIIIVDALVLAGSQSVAMYIRGSNGFFLERAAISTLPIAIDDPPMAKSVSSSLDINDLIVDLYNGCKTANLRKGSSEPQSIPIIATNFNLKTQQRYNTRIQCHHKQRRTSS